MIDAILRDCMLDHVGCLIAASDPREVADYLHAQGLQPLPPVRSSVVRDRLAARHRIPDDRLALGHLDVLITHAALEGGGSPGVEVFHLDPDELSALAMRSERLGQHEHHIAVRLTEPGGRRLEHLRRALTRGDELRPDGGGHNPVYGGGTTVLHFRADGRTRMGWPRRLEIIAAGHHTEVLRRHLAASMAGRRVPAAGRAGRRPASPAAPEVASAGGAAGAPRVSGAAAGDDEESRRLLRLLTSAWVTQAVRAMVLLDLPDHLAARPLSSQELAIRTGTAPDRLDRLLRALSHPWIAAIAPAEDGYQLTGLGRRLSRHADRSMRHLALLHGDLFYMSFAALPEGIGNDEQPFTTMYGQPLYEYLSAHPRQREAYARAMAEGPPGVRDVAMALDLSHARTVADIGGGNGALLADLCDVYPDIHGLLVERPEAIADARANLGVRGLLGRCSLVTGDFTVRSQLPAGADVYILAGILHDWDDQTCVSILRAIRGAAAENSALLVIERPLPDDPSDPSVAALWDMHLLVNTAGGRERTREQYRHLLSLAGFAAVQERALSLGMAAIIAHPASDSSAPPLTPAGSFRPAR
ncbi:methyltransferase [Actinomadura geliboluensis]|uniref:methyltransferase n=1 Tax=Actinomadura geliboluensis TaxID=882440 RepID=UPI0037191966